MVKVSSLRITALLEFVFVMDKALKDVKGLGI